MEDAYQFVTSVLLHLMMWAGLLTAIGLITWLLKSVIKSILGYKVNW